MRRGNAYLAELADVANSLAFERAEVLGDPAGLQVHDSGEGLVEEGADGGHGEVAGLGLEKGISMVGMSVTSGKVYEPPGCGSWP